MSRRKVSQQKHAMAQARLYFLVHAYMQGHIELGTHLPISPMPMTATLVFSELLEEDVAEDALTLLLHLQCAVLA